MLFLDDVASHCDDQPQGQAQNSVDHSNYECTLNTANLFDL